MKIYWVNENIGGKVQIIHNRKTVDIQICCQPLCLSGKEDYQGKKFL
jgi:hypothetical protein